MSAPRRTAYLEELAAAAVLTLAAGVLSVVLGPQITEPALVRVVVAGIGLAYLVRTLACSNETAGRVVVPALWVGGSAAVWAAGAAPVAFVVLHAAGVWLVRSLHVHERLEEAALDLALGAAALGFAVWAAARVGSLPAAVWCFCVVAAWHVAIPELAAKLARRRAHVPATETSGRNFSRALAAADEALRRIAARR